MRVDGRELSRTIHPTRHRHEGLRVAPHAVLADIEAFQLLGHTDTKPDRPLDQPEHGEAEGEDDNEGDGDGGRLSAKLVQASGVEEPTLADPVELGQGWHGEEATGQGAPNPGQAMGGKAADRVVEVTLDGQDPE